MSNFIEIPTNSDYKVPLMVINEHEQPHTTIVILPAMGMSAKQYLHMATTLHDKGYAVYVTEQRGVGASQLRASPSNDWSYHDMVNNDLKAVLEWIQDQTKGRVYLLGHSIGGHFAAISTAYFSSYYDGLIYVACGTPFYKGYAAHIKIPMYGISYLVIITSNILGYFPAKLLAMGKGKESKSIMSEWAGLVQHNTFSQLGGFETSLEQKIAEYKGPILNVHFADDFFTPPNSNANLIQKFQHNNVKSVLYSESDLDHKASHFGFLKKPKVTAETIDQWLQDRLKS